MEVYETFFNYYNHDFEILTIVKQLEEDFSDTIKLEEASNDYWFAIAKALWECKSLDTKTYEIVREIINSGKDIEIWKRLDASKSDIEKRKKILEKFLNQISIAKDKPKARKKIKLYSGYYEKGDCLTFKMKNGNYGGVFVLESEIDTREGYNCIAALDISGATLPTISDFENARILTKRWTSNYGTLTVDREAFLVRHFERKDYRYNKSVDDFYKIIGNINFNKELNRELISIHILQGWTTFINEVEEAFDKIEQGEKENISARLIDWIR